MNFGGCNVLWEGLSTNLYYIADTFELYTEYYPTLSSK